MASLNSALNPMREGAGYATFGTTNEPLVGAPKRQHATTARKRWVVRVKELHARAVSLGVFSELEDAALEGTEAAVREQLRDYAQLMALLDLWIERHSGFAGGGGDGGGAPAPKGAAAAAAAAAAPAAAAAADDAERANALRRKEVLSTLACCLSDAGVPVWGLEFHLACVAKALGQTGSLDVCVLPSEVLLGFPAQGHSAVYVKTPRGLNMSKLQDVDALCRRLATFATSSTDGGGRDAAAAHAGAHAAGARERGRKKLAAAAAVARIETPRLLEAARDKYRLTPAPALAKAILDFASTGPGYFHFHADDPSSNPAPREESFFDIAEGAESDVGRHKARRAAFTSLALDEAARSLAAINGAPPLYGRGTHVLAMAITSAGPSLAMFGSGWPEVAVSGLLGAAIAAFGLFVASHGRWARGFEFLAPMIVGLAVRLVDAFAVPLCLEKVILCSLIFLLQGWTLTSAVLEIATGQQLAGTAHLAAGMVTTGIMGFGLNVGTSLAQALGAAPSDQSLGAGGACTRSVPSPFGATSAWGGVFWLPFYFLIALSISVLLSARRSQLPSMATVAVMAILLSTKLPATAVGDLSTFVSAFVVGVVGNALSNASGLPGAPAVSIGVFLMTPGGPALQSATGGMGENGSGADAGTALTGKVLSVAISIAAGLFMADLAVPHRETVLIRHLKNGKSYQRSTLPPVGL